MEHNRLDADGPRGRIQVAPTRHLSTACAIRQASVAALAEVVPGVLVHG